MACYLQHPGPMLSLHRAAVLTIALATIAACEDPFANHGLDHAPGVAVPGLTNVFIPGRQGLAWSPDSKTLYIAAMTYSGTGGGSLMALDPATLSLRTIGHPSGVLNPWASADGTALYFIAAEQGVKGTIIERLSLSDGAVTRLAITGTQDFLVAPDGTALVYHANHSLEQDPTLDTLVVMDIPTGARRATTVGPPTLLLAISADGSRIVMDVFGDTSEVAIWDLTASRRDAIPLPKGKVVSDAAWLRGSFHLLMANFDSRTLTDTSLDGGPAVTFGVAGKWGEFQWLPDRAAVWIFPSSRLCGPQDCSGMRYDFDFVTPTSSTTLGGAGYDGGFPPGMAPSPDGQWLAHTEDQRHLFLIHNRTP
jgi:hypothetical protein